MIKIHHHKNSTSAYLEIYKSLTRNILKLTSDTVKKIKFDKEIAEQEKTLPIMYWLLTMLKTPIGKRFIVASKNCSSKPLSDVTSKLFLT